MNELYMMNHGDDVEVPEIRTTRAVQWNFPGIPRLHPRMLLPRESNSARIPPSSETGYSCALPISCTKALIMPLYSTFQKSASGWSSTDQFIDYHGTTTRAMAPTLTYLLCSPANQMFVLASIVRNNISLEYCHLHNYARYFSPSNPKF